MASSFWYNVAFWLFSRARAGVRLFDFFHEHGCGFLTTFTRKGEAFWLFSHAGVMLFGSSHAQGRGFWLFSRAWVKLLGIFHAKG